MAQEKFGGLPWGLPLERWPRCRACGKPQTLLAELHHAPPRLDLGRAGRVLFIFHCNNDPGACRDWDQDSGGNAAVIVELHELGSGLTRPELPETPTYLEVRVLAWVELDDGVSPDLANSFYSDDLHSDLDETTRQRVTPETRVGGFPYWIQSPDDSPAGFRFIGQLDATYSFYSPLPPPSKRGGVVYGVAENDLYEGRTWYLDGPNFGDGGIGYVFFRHTGGIPEAKFFWQCG